MGEDFTYSYELTDYGLTITFNPLEDSVLDAENDEVAIFNLSGFVCYDWPFNAEPDSQETYIDQGFATLEITIINDESGIIVGTGETDLLNGTAFGNLICGFDGDDVIRGRDGDDELKGGNGDDVIYGNGGDDRLFGGKGNDVLKAGSGNDLLKGGAGADVLVGGSGENRLIGGGGADVLKGEGGEDFLKGGGGADVLYGGADNDLLKSGNGDDVLYGGSGDDILIGGRGLDVLRGGVGADQLTGGGGPDVFAFRSVSHSTPSSGYDTITDFNSGQMDIIDLSPIDAQSGSGNQAFDYIGTAEFSETMGELRIETVGPDIHVQADIDGDGQADFLLVVADVATLSASDFSL